MIDAVDVNLALMRTGATLAPVRRVGAGRKLRPQPSFERLWHNARRVSRTDREQARLWYPDALDMLWRMSNAYGVPAPIVVACAAVLSPGLRWEKTLRVLGVTLDAYVVGLPTFPRTGDATFGFRDRAKAWEILRTGNLSLCTGEKVEAFRNALAGDTEAIVVDRHLVRLTTGADDLAQMHPAANERMRAEVRVLAWSWHMTPRDTQAALWSVHSGYEGTRETY